MANKRKKTNRSSGYGRKTRSLAKGVTARDAAHAHLNAPKPIRVIDLNNPIYVSNLIREQARKPNYTRLERVVLFLAGIAAEIMIMVEAQLIQAAAMAALIFGGCCSNVGLSGERDMQWNPHYLTYMLPGMLIRIL